MPATTTVLTNPYLLHEILSHLPQPDLLLSQRVSHLWQSTIQSSTPLKTLLFLHPEPPSPSAPIILNPLLQDHFQDFFIPRFRPRKSGPGFRMTSRWFVAATDADGDPETSRRRARAYARAEASWRKMLPCRPAPVELQLLEQVHGPRGTSGRFRKAVGFGGIVDGGVEGEGGEGKGKGKGDGNGNGKWLRFGAIYDVVQSFAFPDRRFERVETCIGGYVDGVSAERELVWRLAEAAQDGPEAEREVVERFEAAERREAGKVRKLRGHLEGRNFLGHGCVVIRRSRTVKYRVPVPAAEFPEEFLRSEASLEGQEGKKGVVWGEPVEVRMWFK